MSYELVLVDPVFFIEKGMCETYGPWQHSCPGLLGAGIPGVNSCAWWKREWGGARVTEFVVSNYCIALV